MGLSRALRRPRVATMRDRKARISLGAEAHLSRDMVAPRRLRQAEMMGVYEEEEGPRWVHKGRKMLMKKFQEPLEQTWVAERTCLVWLAFPPSNPNLRPSFRDCKPAPGGVPKPL